MTYLDIIAALLLRAHACSDPAPEVIAHSATPTPKARERAKGGK